MRATSNVHAGRRFPTPELKALLIRSEAKALLIRQQTLTTQHQATAYSKQPYL